MTATVLLDELAKFLKEVNKDYRLSDELVRGNELIVVPGFLKRRENAIETFYPHIVPRFIKGSDTTSDSNVSVKIFFGTYCEDVNDGWRELYNLMEHTRLALLKQKIIGKKFMLEGNLEYEIPEEQPYPEWVGFMSAEYSIPRPREELKI